MVTVERIASGITGFLATLVVYSTAAVVLFACYRISCASDDSCLSAVVLAEGLSAYSPSREALAYRSQSTQQTIQKSSGH